MDELLLQLGDLNLSIQQRNGLKSLSYAAFEKQCEARKQVYYLEHDYSFWLLSLLGIK